jgi:hypothetical protein
VRSDSFRELTSTLTHLLVNDVPAVFLLAGLSIAATVLAFQFVATIVAIWFHYTPLILISVDLPHFVQRNVEDSMLPIEGIEVNVVLFVTSRQALHCE